MTTQRQVKIRTIAPGRSACLACYDDAKKEGIERSKYLEALPLPRKRLLRGSVTIKEEKEVSDIVSFMSKLPTKLGALTEVDEGGGGGGRGGNDSGSESGTPRKKKRKSVRRRSEAQGARQRKEQAEKAQSTEEEATRRILLMGRRVNAAQ